LRNRFGRTGGRYWLTPKCANQEKAGADKEERHRQVANPDRSADIRHRCSISALALHDPTILIAARKRTNRFLEVDELPPGNAALTTFDTFPNEKAKRIVPSNSSVHIFESVSQGGILALEFGTSGH